MEREQQHNQNENGNKDINRTMGNIDNEKSQMEQTDFVNKSGPHQDIQPMDSEKEDLINADISNIDTMREDYGDRDSLNMEIKKVDNNKIINEDSNPEKQINIKQSSLKEKLKSLSKIVSNYMEGTWNSYINISGSNLLFPVLFFIGTLLYLEVILHLLIYRSVDMKIIYPLLFAIPLGIFLAFITGLFRSKTNKFLMWAITIGICIIFLTQLVYFSVFKVFFSFQSLSMAGDAISEFGADITTAIKANIGGMILLIIPLIILALIMNNLIDYTRRGIKEQGVLLGASILFHIVVLVTLLLYGKGDYSPFDLYYNSQVNDLCGEQLGIATMTRIDIGNMVFGMEELVLADTMAIQTDTKPIPTQILTPIPTPNIIVTTAPANVNATPIPTLPPTPIDTSPNILDIDFNALAKKEKDDTIQTLHNYFASATPTNKNEYTGMFKGYNLIMITAEGFSPYAINKEKTPTLYRLVREGFVFNNFYTALWQTSTSDGEFVAMTGLIPTGIRDMYTGRTNLWPFSLGNQFSLLGVESKAYHNHTFTYYQRNETHPNLGYLFKAKGNGLFLENPDVWPASDLELINATVEEYAEEDQFHVYYLTVSGHMNYTFAGNSMSNKNKNLVKDLSYSADARAYIACQMELDKALEQLIAKLEQAGVADRTVIALSADHYPYGWEKYKLDELAGHEIEPNFEVYKNHFILWNAGMKERIVIDEPCSSLDILPTLSNLFGLEYDSRLLMGQDILSEAAPLVILSNRSFITDKVKYNSSTREVTLLTEDALPNDYISNLNKVITNKFSISKNILNKDYYRYVFQE